MCHPLYAFACSPSIKPCDHGKVLTHCTCLHVQMLIVIIEFCIKYPLASWCYLIIVNINKLFHFWCNYVCKCLFHFRIIVKCIILINFFILYL
uniref:Uncharacterized protein n=1 Tax=Rhizophora mucronata TaxID=61149 RepID=A0A2P2NIV4_RHIMU